MKRHQNDSIRQCLANGIKRFEAEAEYVVKVNDIRVEIANKPQQIAADFVGVFI